MSNAPGLVVEVKGIRHVGASNILSDYEAPAHRKWDVAYVDRWALSPESVSRRHWVYLNGTPLWCDETDRVTASWQTFAMWLKAKLHRSTAIPSAAADRVNTSRQAFFQERLVHYTVTQHCMVEVQTVSRSESG